MEKVLDMLYYFFMVLDMRICGTREKDVDLVAKLYKEDTC